MDSSASARYGNAATLGIEAFARAMRHLQPPPAYRIALDSGVGFASVRRALERPQATRLATWLKIVGSVGLALVGVERGDGAGEGTGSLRFCAVDEDAAPALGAALRARRRARSWSRREAARQAGMSVAAVASAESGRGDLLHLERLCAALGMELRLALPAHQSSLEALWKERAPRCLQRPARYPVTPWSER